MVESKEVELLPATHIFSAEAHNQLINYIKTQVPNNSILALETTMHQFNLLHLALEKYFTGKAKQYSSRKLNFVFDIDFVQKSLNPRKNEMPHDIWYAMLELFFVCRQKNINIVPIETVNVLANPKRNKDYEKDQVREEGFARQIKALLAGKPKGKVFVYTGSSHTFGLSEELTRLGISNTTNTSFYDPSQKAIVERSVLANKLERTTRMDDYYSYKAASSEIPLPKDFTTATRYSIADDESKVVDFKKQAELRKRLLEAIAKDRDKRKERIIRKLGKKRFLEELRLKKPK